LFSQRRRDAKKVIIFNLGVLARNKFSNVVFWDQVCHEGKFEQRGKTVFNNSVFSVLSVVQQQGWLCHVN